VHTLEPALHRGDGPIYFQHDDLLLSRPASILGATMKVDQRGIDNQRSAFLTATEASALLDVKLATIYAYAARGLLRPVPAGRGRARLYPRSELELLRAGHDARSGHGPVAAAAMRFGEPVLESALTAIDEDGFRYRGHAVRELTRAGTP